jgi:hypothetical protein
VIPASLGAAFVVGLLAQRLAPAGWKEATALGAAWVALYPIPRLKPKIPWWWHWVQGLFIMLGALMVLRASV